MAFIETESQRIVVRVVYDGPVMAGKTTNICELYDVFRSRHGSEIVSPGQIGERTVFMDWLRVETGMDSGRPLASHFISVPGQRLLERRRQLLLDLADAVVFVCSAERNALDETVSAFATLRRKLADRSDEVPIVIQHNKQDHPNPLPERELREALELHPEVRVIPARAHEGVGVRETAGVAVRAAAKRVRSIVQSQGYAGLDGYDADAHALAEQMRQGERVLAFDRANANPEALLAGEAQERDSFQPPRPRAPVPGLPGLPAGDSPSGMIWPADEGRSILRRALAANPELENHTEARRLRFDAEVWSLWVDRHTRFAHVDAARAALLRVVRRSVHLGPLRFPQMALTLAPEQSAEVPAPEDGGWFIWRISPGAASIKDTLDYGARGRTTGNLTEQLLGYLAGVAAAAELERSLGTSLGLELSPDAFCLVGTRPYYLFDDRTRERTTPLVDALMAPLGELSFPIYVLERYAKAIRETFEAPIAQPILRHLEEEVK